MNLRLFPLLLAIVVPPAAAAAPPIATTAIALDPHKKVEVVETMATAAEQRYVDASAGAKIVATNFGFDKVERLSGNVGYLKLTRLVPLQLSRDSAARAMSSLNGAAAVIIDLSDVPGGSPDLVVQLVSFFTGDKPQRLLATYNRGLDQTEELWSVPDVDGSRLTGVPLYILQDRHSASAAEMFSYFVQRQKLGTVIGERSAGAGHGGNMLPVGSDISFFLPQMRIIDGPGWEGTGVIPEVQSSGTGALKIAHAAAVAEIEARRRRPRA